jgi:hypothetical protein
MMLQDKIAQMSINDMGVDLGCGEVGVTEHGLDHSQVGTTCQQVRRKGVTQDMGSDPFGIYFRDHSQLLDHRKEGLSCEMS